MSVTDSAGQNWSLPSFEPHEFIERQTRYCLVIPVINEGVRIQRQLVRMKPFVTGLDVIIADGGSTDGSLRSDSMRDHGVSVLLVKKGPGQLSAQLRMGMGFALQRGYEGVVLIDGNDKDNPAGIARFVAALSDGYDHIQGSRFVRGGVAERTPLSRLLGVRLVHAPLISLAAGFHYTDTTNGFRAYSRRFLLDPAVAPFRDVFQRYELHYYLSIRAPRLGYRVCEVPVERAYPEGEKTPTKISGFSGNLEIMRSLVRACLGRYSPEDPSR